MKTASLAPGGARTEADQAYLRQSIQQCLDLQKEMLDITHAEGFTWQL